MLCGNWIPRRQKAVFSTQLLAKIYESRELAQEVTECQVDQRDRVIQAAANNAIETPQSFLECRDTKV